MDGCRFCDTKVFAKVRRYTRPILAPLTPEGALMQELTEKTGWEYVQIDNRFCPMCGKEISEKCQTVQKPSRT